MAHHQFTAVDYVVFALTVITSIAIGLFFSRRRHETTTDEYLMAGRSMRSIPIALSLTASFLSAVSILGIPTEVYYYGAQFWISAFATFFVVPLVVLIYLPIFYQLKLTSVYEYLQRRFSTTVRLIASVIFITQTILYSAVVIFAPAIALDAVSDFPTWATILIGGAVATLYTAMGGIRAVIWTDVFQSIVMLGGLLTMIIMGTVHMGGPGTVFHRAHNGSRLDVLNFNPNPTERLSFWSLFIGGTFTSLPMWGVSQTSVQRMLTSRSLKSAKRSMWLMLPLTILSVTLCCLTGLVIYAVFADCDPLAACLIKRQDQIVPYFVVDILGGAYGIPGLFLSSLVCGTLSTISSNLNAISAVTLEDFVRKRRRNMTDKAATITSRCLAVGYGILIIVLSFGFAQIHTSQLIKASMSVLGATGGPLLGVFTLGMFSKKATNKGALIGLAAGLFLTSWITIGAELFPNPDWKQLPNSTSGCNANASLIGSYSCADKAKSLPEYDRARGLYGISFMWYGLIGSLTTYLTGYLMSLLLPGRKVPVDKNLLVTFDPHKWSLLFWKYSHNNSEVQYVEMNDQLQMPSDRDLPDGGVSTKQSDILPLLETASESEF